MAEQALQIEMPLIKRPVAEILAAARAAGRQAFTLRETLDSAWQEAAFAWIDKMLPENCGMSDEYVNDLLEKARAAFEEGVDEYLGTIEKAAQSPAPRLPGVGYWFSEDDSLAFGLTVDMSKFCVEKFDSEALFSRFHARLLSEYDRLALQLQATRRADGIDVSVLNLEYGPLSITLPIDENLFLQIVPSAIDRETLVMQLPGVLKNFVELLGQVVEVAHD